VADFTTIHAGSNSTAVFERIYRDHSEGVFGVARHLCGTSMAADVTQEVFLRFWRYPGRFNPHQGTLHSLLLTMSHNISVDTIRSENARRSRELRTHVTDTIHPDGDAGLIEEEGNEQLRLALTRLPTEQRDAIVTAFFGHCTYQEAANVLNLPEGTVKSRIRLGIMRLREELTELPEAIDAQQRATAAL
jgi:RNA polymerase sigma-70 factor (ECF subfamily)